METIEELTQTVAKNLTVYRKRANLTQAELAQKLNYSDKSVSKWESGNGLPDVFVLKTLADLYGVSVDELVGSKASETKFSRVSRFSQILIMLLSSSIVWLVATVCFVVFRFLIPKWSAVMFIYAIPVNAVVIVVFSSVWKNRLTNFCAVSVLIWTTILSLFMTAKIISGYGGNWWILFLVGIPLEIMEAQWQLFRKMKKKTRNQNGKKEAEPYESV